MIVDIASGEMFHIRIENGQTITMPATTTGQTVMGMVARPATVDTYAVDVDAGSLVFNQIAMVEGVQCWFDRDAYTYEGIPPALIPGTLLQGNHKAIPSGTTISITSDGQSQGLVVHVFYTMESERRGGWDSSLEPAGWISEGDGPNWMYQGNPQPMDMWKSLLLPGQTVSLPATTTGQTVMGLVVRPATTDEIVNGGGSGGNDSGSTAVDVVGGYAHMNFRGEDWYLVRRDHSVDGGCGPEEPRRGAPIGWRLEARPDREQRHGGSLRELGHEAVVADVVGGDDGDNRRVREREHGIQRGWLVKNGLFPQMQLDAR